MPQKSLQPTDEEVDLALAAELQAALLPRECPSDCPHQRAAARNRMSNTIGGDFYDFIRLNQDQVAIVIGDVAGHGVRSSLIMAQIMGFMRSSSGILSRPGQIIKGVNRMLMDLGERTGLVLPCSMFYGVIDAPTGMGVFVNAGHPRPWVLDRSGGLVFTISPHSIMLGIDDFEPKEACLTFEPSQRLILYTDGMTDAANPAGEHFGEQRLLEAVRAHDNSPPEEAADGVFAIVESFRAGAKAIDDETIVIIDRV